MSRMSSLLLVIGLCLSLRNFATASDLILRGMAEGNTIMAWNIFLENVPTRQSSGDSAALESIMQDCPVQEALAPPHWIHKPIPHSNLE